jgi:hypothetical protein
MEIEMSLIECAECGMPFGITKDREQRLRKCHNTFFCPAGHRQSPGVQYGLLIVWIGAGIIGYISGTLSARIENRQYHHREVSRGQGSTPAPLRCNFCSGTHGWHEEDCPATDH